MERAGGVQRETHKLKLRNSSPGSWLDTGCSHCCAGESGRGLLSRRRRRAARRQLASNREEQGAHSPGHAQTGKQPQHGSSGLRADCSPAMCTDLEQAKVVLRLPEEAGGCESFQGSRKPCGTWPSEESLGWGNVGVQLTLLLKQISGCG